MKSLQYIIIALLLASCSKFARLTKTTDTEKKYQGALEYYQAENYAKASVLFEDLLQKVHGTAQAEKVHYYFAYCKYHTEEYSLSAHYFKSFFDTYRRSDLAEEAYYMHAHSLFMNTPEYYLDQSNTTEAITTLQEFLNRYPTSQYAPKVTEEMTLLQKRLETKAYEISKQYHRLRRYKAAVVAYNNYHKDYPDSEKREEVYFKKIEAGYDLARLSVQSLKAERYQNTVDTYLKFADRYPNSKYLRAAEKIYESCRKQLVALEAEAKK